MHGDHVLGLPGLLQTMSLLNIKHSIEVYGPPGIYNFLKNIVKLLQFNLTFPVKIKEVEEGIVLEGKEYVVEAVWTEHNIPNLAYALIEKERPGKFYPKKATSLGVPKGPLWRELQKGKEVHLPNGRIIRPKQVMGPPRPGRKIVYSGDTRPCSAIIDLAKEADLLIYEATFDDKLAEKAERRGHSTPSQSAFIAKKANVKKLVLTHISSRYYDNNLLYEQAKKIFPKVTVAKDFMDLRIAFTK